MALQLDARWRYDRFGNRGSTRRQEQLSERLRKNRTAPCAGREYWHLPRRHWVIARKLGDGFPHAKVEVSPPQPFRYDERMFRR
jgi:hypothetical protein